MLDGNETQKGLTETAQTRQKAQPKPLGRAKTARRTRAEQLTEEEMNAAALAHGSVLLGFITGGLARVATAFILWLIYDDKSNCVAFQALQAIAFQLLLTVATVLVGLAIVVSALTICLIPLALILLLGVIALPFAQLLYGLYTAYETYHGADFVY